MKNFWLKFASRKFLVALLGVVISLIAETVNIPPEILAWIMKILAVYIGGEAAADFARNLNRPSE